MGVNLGGSLMSGITNAKLAELYELVKNGGMSLADAMRRLGIDKKISEKTAQHLLKTRYGLQVAGGGGIIGTLGAFGASLGLKGGAAVAAGAVTATVILGGIALGGYILAGQIGAFAGDKAVKPGRAMSGSHERNVDEPVVQKKSSEPYGVFVGGGYNEVIVGQESVIMGATTSSLIGWGRDSSKTVKDTGATFRMVLGPFKTAEEARRAFDENLEPGSERIKPFASGRCARFKFDGKEHDIDNAFRLIE